MTHSHASCVVVHVINALTRVGPVQVLEQIIRHSPPQYRAVVVCLRHPDPAGHDAVLADLGVRIHYLHYSLPRLEFATRRVADAVAHYARLEGAHLIHTHGYHPDLLVAYLRDRFICTSTQHNISLEDFTYGKGAWLGRYMHQRLWRSLASAHHVVGITEHVRLYAQSHLPSRVATSTILNGVDTSLYTPASEVQKIEARQCLGIAESSFVWLVCGSLSERKDPQAVIRAFLSLLASGSIPEEACLVFIGAGPLYEQCRSMSLGLEHRIRIEGFRSDVHRYIQAADCLVSASHSEGFGLNVAEALASGLGLIATDLPPHRELLLDHPDLLAFLFPVGDTEVLARLMVRSLSAPRLEHSTLEQLRTHLSARRMATAYASLYDRLVATL